MSPGDGNICPPYFGTASNITDFLGLQDLLFEPPYSRHGLTATGLHSTCAVCKRYDAQFVEESRLQRESFAYRVSDIGATRTDIGWRGILMVIMANTVALDLWRDRPDGFLVA